MNISLADIKAKCWPEHFDPEILDALVELYIRLQNLMVSRRGGPR